MARPPTPAAGRRGCCACSSTSCSSSRCSRCMIVIAAYVKNAGTGMLDRGAGRSRAGPTARASCGSQALALRDRDYLARRPGSRGAAMYVVVRGVDADDRRAAAGRQLPRQRPSTRYSPRRACSSSAWATSGAASPGARCSTGRRTTRPWPTGATAAGHRPGGGDRRALAAALALLNYAFDEIANPALSPARLNTKPRSGRRRAMRGIFPRYAPFVPQSLHSVHRPPRAVGPDPRGDRHA